VALAALSAQQEGADREARRLAEQSRSLESEAQRRRGHAATLQAGDQSAEAAALAERLAEAAQLQASEHELMLAALRGRREAVDAASLSLRSEVKALGERRTELVERRHRVELELAAVEHEAVPHRDWLAEEYDLSLDAVPPDAAGSIADDAAAEIGRLRRQLRALGAVNPEAEAEYDRVAERYGFLTEQRDDLLSAEGGLLTSIREIDEASRGLFTAAFEAIGEAFQTMFDRLFGGGKTELVLTDPGDILESGIEVVVQPPGKSRQNLLLLSGGERALTATALLFALLQVRPSPFVVLDEVDAPLDDANVVRFGELLREMAQRSQFIVITHNRGTMEAADLLYGVTMADAGISQTLSLRLADAVEAAGVAA
jgi:chromosome segregation protein